MAGYQLRDENYGENALSGGMTKKLLYLLFLLCNLVELEQYPLENRVKQEGCLFKL